MLINSYLRTALRSFRKNRTYMAISISGFAIAFSMAMIILIYITTHLTAEDVHTRKSDIYRVVNNLKAQNNLFSFAVTPPQLGTFLRNDFPAIEQVVRLFPTARTFQHNEDTFVEPESFYADPSLFAVFDLEWRQGNKQRALEEPYSLVITETTARKYFGETPALGKVLKEIDQDQEWTVMGIVSDPPSTTHLQFDVLLSFSSLYLLNPDLDKGFFNLSGYTYILADPLTAEAVHENLTSFTERNYGEVQKSANQYYTFILQPLSKIHFSNEYTVDIGTKGSWRDIFILSACALLVLVIGSINFINLCLARSVSRSKEVGVRKAIGATKIQLILQFIGESWVICMISYLLALLAVYVSTPWLAILFSMKVSFDISWVIAGFLISSCIALLAGLYPGFVLASLKPALVIKSVAASTKNWVRSGLITWQVTISFFLIVTSLVVINQKDYMQNFELGFNKRMLSVIDFRYSPDIQRKYLYVKHELLKIPGVESVATSNYSLDMNPLNWYTSYESSQGTTENTSIYGLVIDHDFLPTHKIDLIVGRNLSLDFPQDTAVAYLVNESAVKFLGWQSPQEAIGKKIMQLGRPGQVVGVVRNFHFTSLHNKVEPLAMLMHRERFSRFCLRLQSNRQDETIASIQNFWKENFPEVPFELSTVEHTLSERYNNEEQLAGILVGFALVSTLLTTLGVVGLVFFMMENAKREIAIRKTFGALPRNLYTRFGWYFVKLTFIGCILAVPVSWYASHQWLDLFPFKEGIQWQFFLFAAVVVLVMSVVSMSIQLRNAINTNPSVILRQEQ